MDTNEGASIGSNDGTPAEGTQDSGEESIVETRESTIETKEPETITESPEAKFARLNRMRDQHLKKHPELVVKPTKKSSKKSDEFGYDKKAFLFANGIKESTEIELVKDIVANTGKSLEEVLESKYFKAELTEMREAKASADALPKGTKRTGQSAQDTVEYWIAKGELPPASDRELRRKVVNAKMEKKKSNNRFTNNPVVQ